MKVILLNGSPHKEGTTYVALAEVAGALEKQGVESEIVQIDFKHTKGCTACGACSKLGKCVIDDDNVNEVLEKMKTADGLIVGSPVYYASANGSLISFLDRLFYSGKKYMEHKPAAAVAVARRAGTIQAFDDINKYFTISQMPVVSSTYWNCVFGRNAEDAKQDAEGLQTMRNLGTNMAWLLKCIEAGKKNGVEVPVAEGGNVTNFIR